MNDEQKQQLRTVITSTLSADMPTADSAIKMYMQSKGKEIVSMLVNSGAKTPPASDVD